MSSQPMDPIALDITSHSLAMTEVLLSYDVSLVVKDNITHLKIVDQRETVKVPRLCLDSLRFLIHQLHLYQDAAKTFRTLPKSPEVDETLDFYLSLVRYCSMIITAFHREAKVDRSSFTPKWRSAHLDYYIAMLVYDSAFTEERQIAALASMKRTWIQFKEKKAFKTVTQMTAKRLHETHCVDGKNMCGGPFSHIHSVDMVIAQLIEDVTSSDPAALTNVNTTQKTTDVEDDDESIKAAPKKRRAVKATTVPSATSKKSQDVMQVDVEAVKSPIQSKRPGLRSTKMKNDVSQQSPATVQGSSKMRESDALHTGDEVGERFISHITSNTFQQSTAEQIASRYQVQDDAKKSQKNRKPARKSKAGKGKSKAAPVIVDSDSDPIETSSMHADVPSIINADSSHSMQSDAEGEDDGRGLPPVRGDWEWWTQVAFEDGNSHVFLKLASWMLLRFRQLSHADIDDEVNGIVIPGSPRLMEFKNEDDFFEALGMERLYSAIVHMDTTSRFLSHIFHALGKVISESDVGQSNPTMWPAMSPPAVEESTMSAIHFPWKGFNNMGGEAEGATEPDSNDEDVTDAMNSMLIDDKPAHSGHGSMLSAHPSAKRKRSSSQGSPLKKDGGRGPSKRPKDGHASNVQSPSISPSPNDLRVSDSMSSANMDTISELNVVMDTRSQQDEPSTIPEYDGDVAITPASGPTNSPDIAGPSPAGLTVALPSPIVLVRRTPSPAPERVLCTLPAESTNPETSVSTPSLSLERSAASIPLAEVDDCSMTISKLEGDNDEWLTMMTRTLPSDT
ncbi:uncharacterized protein EDB91DRAFT_1257449 [Suillus paluster]|uniref:uncharacterized protein n=1 Tax=Suillus paluster TaxID=48578 RepID=UPI001B87871E|nr:uncharacterized protein EDB91DRAFT_1257449 [Suillus paluster]KAG1719707.1 hypothetical protein EDB91DRAFT_1257449 [Suillus paluster]